MLPVLAANNPIDCVVADLRILLRYLANSDSLRRFAPDGLDAALCELRMGMIFAPSQLAERGCVAHVLQLRDVAQIFRPIVRFVAVYVADDFSLRSWPKEMQRHQDVDLYAPFAATVTQDDVLVSVAVGAWLVEDEGDLRAGRLSDSMQFSVVG